MTTVARMIQALILFSTILGVFFLWEVYPLLPAFVFDALAFGWVLFVIDSVLTFTKPRIAYYLGLVLALLTLAATLSQPEHYALVGGGNISATATLIAGSAAQIGIVIAVLYYVRTQRRRKPA